MGQNIATEIRVCLAGDNTSRKELAEKTGIPLRRINRMCEGKHDFTIEEIVSLEKALGIKLMLMPDTERVITIRMSIDTVAGAGLTSMDITENGHPKEDWTASQLVSTANALIMKARQLSEMAITKARENEKEYVLTLRKLVQYEAKEEQNASDTEHQG